MNYKHQNTVAEHYDPDSKVVRSTQTTEQNASDQGTGGAGGVSVASALPDASKGASGDASKSDSTRTEETTNYEISKTTKTSTVDGGDLKRLSVAVVVDGVSTTDANGHESYKPRTPAEMKQIGDLVKSAIGFDTKSRGDVVQVDNMAFAHIDTGPVTPAAAPLLGMDSGQWFKIIEVAILSLTALLIGFFVARPLISRMFAPNAHGPLLTAPQPVAGQLSAPQAAHQPGDAQASLPAPKESMIDISRIEGQVRESSIKKVGEVVQSHPEEALAIIRTWLHEPA